ncbi:MAG: hypothetical protein ACTSPB_02140 [Candidatus Thorarchaeota archaeon]
MLTKSKGAIALLLITVLLVGVAKWPKFEKLPNSSTITKPSEDNEKISRLEEHRKTFFSSMFSEYPKNCTIVWEEGNITSGKYTVIVNCTW